LVGGRHPKPNHSFVWFIIHDVAVLNRKPWYHLWPIHTPMARPTSYFALASEICLVNCCNHHDHLARCLLKWCVVGILCPVPSAFFGVALRTIEACGSREETHSLHEFVDRYPPQ